MDLYYFSFRYKTKDVGGNMNDISSLFDGELKDLIFVLCTGVEIP
jgi:hypothetical protein